MIEQKFKRNALKLLENVEYIYREDGTVNWRAMVPVEFLGVKKDKVDEVEKKYGKPISELNLKEVDDKYLFILLGGIKYLLQLRGFKSVKQKVEYIGTRKSVVTCSITFIGNYETDYQEIEYSSVAAASDENVHKDFLSYLESIAENRSLVRCVRGALNINIVGKDELSSINQSSADDSTPEASGLHVQDMLKDKSAVKNLSFDDVKRVSSLKYKDQLSTDPESWTSWDSIPPKDCYFLAGKIK